MADSPQGPKDDVHAEERGPRPPVQAPERNESTPVGTAMPVAPHREPRPPVVPPENHGTGGTSAPLDKDRPAIKHDMRTEGPKKEKAPEKQDNSFTANIRRNTIKALPAFIVNNSVTFISVMHLAAELLMLKSGGMKFLKNNRGGDKVNYLIDPANNLWRGLRGLDKANGAKATQNVWALRSTATGFSGWILGTIMPNKKEDPQAIAEDKALWDKSRLGYVGKHFSNALQFWKPENKRESVGLAVTGAGIFSALSGFTSIGGNGRYYTNWTRSIGGGITALGGSALLLSATDREAWTRYGEALWMRLPFIGMSIHKMHNKTIEFKGAHDVEAYLKANKEWKYYAGGASLFQAAGFVSFLFGGAQKLPDGTIVDTGGGHGGGSDAADKKGDVLAQNAPHTKITKVAAHVQPEQGQQLSS